MSFLYIQEQGSKIGVSAGRINIEGGEMSRSIPIENIESLIITGNVQISSKSVPALLEAGVSVTWLSPKGQFYGRLYSTKHEDVSKQRRQFEAQSDKEFNLEFSKRIIDAKIKNQTVIVRRYRDKIGEDADYLAETIGYYREKVKRAEDITQLNGFEGIASRYYFYALSKIFENNEDFKFKGRTKQPPTDRFNSLLSFGYTLLMYEVQTAIELNGLNPFAGCMHSDRKSHPSLASDLMEEWRAVLIDSMVISSIERNMFKADRFVSDEETGGVYLDKEATRKFVGLYERRVSAHANYLSYINQSVPFRKAIRSQVGMLVKAFKDKDPEIYIPVYIR